MFETIMNFFKKFNKNEKEVANSKDTAKERLHLVLMQDRANVSADFLELMKQEIIEVIKKYIDVDESAIDVRLTNKENEDGTNGAPALYANIPILNIKNEAKKVETKEEKKDEKEEKVEEATTKKPEKEEEKKESETAQVIIDDGEEEKDKQEVEEVKEDKEEENGESSESSTKEEDKSEN